LAKEFILSLFAIEPAGRGVAKAMLKARAAWPEATYRRTW
jgi:hypothetical protein